MASFDWDPEDQEDGNVQHIRDHGFEPCDVEEVFENRRHRPMKVDASNTAGEERWGLIGETEEGTLVKIIFTRRKGQIRPITAERPTENERKRWRKFKGGRS